ncbi:Histidine kinase-- DNA gyrase B-- and HSP90-like ATPase family protein [Striga hermonthica]|uniref:Histidine kinase-- DNA gyrase B-- and HSP90-like ATPase family protein n=1 Tax=Striga hermonthica TaxID=68872 RepID=A0A9N7NDR8_STRHE|nr:Histidine kinase-- DNA gyrase B-- and HSP90-like ATPase family protein [Striga hermonthica]
MGTCVKPEQRKRPREIIPLSSSSSGDLSVSSSESYKQKKAITGAVLPVGFLDPLSTPGGVSNYSMDVGVVKEEEEGHNNSLVIELKSRPIAATATTTSAALAVSSGCRQFWKAGDYETSSSCGGQVSLADMDHVRVHPRFLHSNATSHKWALGAFAELLDNSLDEDCNGATYVLVDVLENLEDNNKMVLVQDDGGGMTPGKMRQCMSLGYSDKSKMANTIGQYGNGFKTSTMRLGADVIVFSRCRGYGGRATQSIGLLSYTFLRSTGKEDIVVPMIDYEKVGETWNKCVKSSAECWQRNIDTIVQWSPYESEEDLLGQFDFLNNQGTRIIIYNLWEDEQGLLELDFDTDPHDIQIRGVNRDDKKIEMAKVFSSSRHFLTYRHSLRSYTSILYLNLPPSFHIILRGKDVDHHNIIDDMMHTKELVYRPAAYADAAPKDPNMSATVTLGFIKDAAHHIDVQGFNVYHKNRLIKPFWRVWNAAGSDGRGVIGVLQANFIEPAHDKQGFERTTALSRLEARLVHFQKTYWSSQCQLIGYAQRRNLKKSVSPDKNFSPSVKDKNNCTYDTNLNKQHNSSNQNEQRSPDGVSRRNQFEARHINSPRPESGTASVNLPIKTEGYNSVGSGALASITDAVIKLKEENLSLRSSLNNALQDLQYEKEKNGSLQNQLQETKQILDKMDKEQEMFVGSFAEERSRREEEEENLRRRLKDASETIQGLLTKVKRLEASTKLG